jgi:CRISPR/Cas system CMR-associated protein Cmr5 small subunit
MPLQNLEQVRAKSAMAFANSPAEKRGKDGGEAIKKIPPMIMGNGLLAAIAFAIEEKFDKKSQSQRLVRDGHAAIFDAIAKHLSSDFISILSGTSSAKQLIDKLADSDSQTLKLATAESLQWLGYARRFVTGGADSDSTQEDEQ